MQESCKRSGSVAGGWRATVPAVSVHLPDPRPVAAADRPRFWRVYSDQAGRTPLREFLDGLPARDAATVVAAMNLVALGRRAAKPLHGQPLFEVKCHAGGQQYRVIFATEGRRSQVLLAVDGFSKKGAEMQQRHIDRAAGRLADWRERGARMRAAGRSGRRDGPPLHGADRLTPLVRTARQAARLQAELG